MFVLQSIDPVKTAIALSNPEIWLGVLLFILMAAVVMLWRQLNTERKENKQDFRKQLDLLIRVETQLVSHQEMKPLVESIKQSVEAIKIKLSL